MQLAGLGKVCKHMGAGASDVMVKVRLLATFILKPRDYSTTCSSVSRRNGPLKLGYLLSDIPVHIGTDGATYIGLCMVNQCSEPFGILFPDTATRNWHSDTSGHLLQHQASKTRPMQVWKIH